MDRHPSHQARFDQTAGGSFRKLVENDQNPGLHRVEFGGLLRESRLQINFLKSQYVNASQTFKASTPQFHPSF